MPPTLPTSSRATRSRFSSPLQSIGATGLADAASTSGGGASSTRHGGSGSTPRSNGNSGHTGNGGSNAQRAMMARWLEPPVQSKTSFEEAGFQRHGVFEGMAPLGTLPKAVNVAKRISGLPEEKQYREGSPSSSRQAAKQPQKKKESLNHQDRQGSQEQQRPEGDANGEAQNEAPAMHAGVNGQEEQPEEQPAPSSQTRKIILKRPSAGNAGNAGKHMPTRIIVGPRRSVRANPDPTQDESAEDDEGVASATPAAAAAATAANASRGAGKARTAKKASLPSTPTTPNRPTTSGTRRSIIFRPAPGKSQKKTRAMRQKPISQSESIPAMDDEADDADLSDQEAGREAEAVTTPKLALPERATTDEAAAEPEAEKPALEKPKPARRPVGRPRSRRSLAAETRTLKEKEPAEAQAGAETEAEAEAEAKRVVADEAKAQIEAETLATPTPDVPQKPSDAQDTGQEGEILDSDGDSFDSKAEDNDGYGGKTNFFTSRHLPLTSGRPFLRPRSDSNATEVNREVTDKVVDHAVDEALRHFRYPTAWALRTLYDEQAGDQTFLTMVEDVFQQTADRDTLDTFVRMVHEKKKEGKKDNKACHHFVPPSTGDDHTLQQKPISAPYADLITMDLPRFGPDGTEIVDADSTDDNVHAKKRVKLTEDDGEDSEDGEDGKDGEHQPFAKGPPSVAMHTFAPPPSPLLPGGDSAAAAESASRDVERHTSATPRKTAAKNKTVIQSPKTPTKTPRRPPGRPPGSKNKTLAEKAAAAANLAGKKPAQKDDARKVEATTPSSAQRRLRNRSGSTASSISSLSSAMSLSPPSKAVRNRKDDEAARLKDATDSASDKEDDVVMHDAHLQLSRRPSEAEEPIAALAEGQDLAEVGGGEVLGAPQRTEPYPPECLLQRKTQNPRPRQRQRQHQRPPCSQ
ncbi:hypothetical protein SCUCBS95973_003213 [Sporothrix curviconia]|uniref:Uncharacterized protein n=1 Tax=Sporothrix curviconia TaxID=1260050 RepID=A0ABP0BEI0_9PEZI